MYVPTGPTLHIYRNNQITKPDIPIAKPERLPKSIAQKFTEKQSSKDYRKT